MSEIETADESTSAGYDEDALLDQATAGGDSEEESAEPAKENEEPVSAIGEDIEKELADNRLRTVPGETREQALLRLKAHYAGRSSNNYSELRQVREQAQRAAAESANLRTVLQPFLRAWQEQQIQAQREAQMAQIPDKETDPAGYQTWLLEQNIRVQAERERWENEQRALAMQQQAQIQQAHQALDVDESALTELEQAVQSDPEVATAYQFVTQSGIRQAERLFPDATHDQILEFVQLAQQRDMRMHAQMGYSVVESIKSTYRDALELAGLTPAQAQAEADRQMPVTPTAPQQRPGQKRNGSPTAQRLERESGAARARAVVSAAPSASGAPTGDGLDIRGMSEEELAEFALSSPKNADLLSKMIAQTYGKSSRFSG